MDIGSRLRFDDFNHEGGQLGGIDGNENDAKTTPNLYETDALRLRTDVPYVAEKAIGPTFR